MPVFDLEMWRQNDPMLYDELLAAIWAAHEKLVERLPSLNEADWSLQARHSWHGLRTLGWWVERNLAEMREAVADLTLGSEA